MAGVVTFWHASDLFVLPPVTGIFGPVRVEELPLAVSLSSLQFTCNSECHNASIYMRKKED